MSILTESLPQYDRLGNSIYYDYRNMVMVEGILRKNNINKPQTWLNALQWIYGDITTDELTGDINDWIKELLWFYSGDKAVKGDTANVEVLCFEQDCEYIHGDFLTAYNIDLTQVQLHWWKFLSLLKALPEDMTMSKRMYYRGVPLNKFSKEERKHIAKIKKALAIKREKTEYKTAEEKAEAYKEKMRERLKKVL